MQQFRLIHEIMSQNHSNLIAEVNRKTTELRCQLNVGLRTLLHATSSTYTGQGRTLPIRNDDDFQVIETQIKNLSYRKALVS